MTTWWTLLPSPVDDLLLTTDGDALTRVYFSPHKGLDTTERVGDAWERDAAHPVLVAAATQLTEYFAGDRRVFDLRLAPSGTHFQQRVWQALRAIPYGQTRSYGQLAAGLAMGRNGSRAVGLAGGANPLSIVVPCHRVIGARGELTGFGGGLERKRYLLDLEADRLF